MNSIGVMRPIFLTFLLLLIQQQHISVQGRSVNRNTPHSHHGRLTPYSPGPFSDFHLLTEDEQILAEGKPVMKQVADTSATQKDEGQGGRAICIQDIHATKEAVWRQILDIDCYGDKVSSVKECKNYSFQVKDKAGKVQFKTKMVIGVMPGYSYENYYDHTYHPSHDSVTWSLDYDKTSDFDDVAGHWHLQDHPTKRGYTRVFYACDIKFKNPIPGPIMNFLTKAALKNATGWVKRESEQHPMDPIPTAFIVGAGMNPSPSIEVEKKKVEEKFQETKRKIFSFGEKTKQLLPFPLKPIFGYRKG